MKTRVPVPEQERLTQKVAADRLGISARLLRRYTAEKRVTRDADGYYLWPKLREEHDAILEAADESHAAGHGNSDYERERARLTKAKADEAERENRIRLGQLIDVNDVEELLRAPLERANAILKNVPSKYGTKLSRKSKLRLPEARALLSEIVELVRAELRASPPKGGTNAAAA